RASAHSHGTAHRPRRRLDGAGRGGAGRGQLRVGIPHRRLPEPPLHRARPARHGADRPARALHGPTHARARAARHPVGRVVALTRARTLLLPIGFVLAWQLVDELQPGLSPTLPPPSRVVAAGWRLLASGDLVAHIGASLVRVLGGFSVAALVAI